MHDTEHNTPLHIRKKEKNTNQEVRVCKAESNYTPAYIWNNYNNRNRFIIHALIQVKWDRVTQ